MSLNVFEIFAKIGLDTKEYERSLKGASSKASVTAKTISTTLSTAGKAIAAVPTAINNAGKAISSFGKSISSVGNSITSKITTPALGAAAALAGIALVKGWNRLTQIDEAKAKLRGLGHDAEAVKDIMESALASVKGTAYGMDEAATTAASAVAAGIGKGEELTNYLTTVGDAAAIAGSSMGDMGAIFNKVVTSGKAQNDVLNQLADKGIPIYQWLAEETGHASDEIFEMAKKGQIDTQTFLNAVKNNVGGAAKELGNATLTGAMANVWAAVSRVGANFLGAADDADSFAGKILPLIIKLQDGLGVLESKAKEWGAVFGDVFGGIVDYFTEGNADVSKMGDIAQEVWGKIEPVLNGIKKGMEFISGLSPELVGGLVSIAVGAGPVISIGGKIIEIIGFLISNGGLLVAGIATLAGALALLAGSGADTTGAFEFLSNLMEQATEKLNEFADFLANFDWEEVSATVKEKIGEIFNFDGDFGDMLTVGVRIIENLVTGIGEAASNLIPAAALVIADFARFLGENSDGAIEAAKNLIMGLASGIIQSIPILIPAVYETASQFLTSLQKAMNSGELQNIAANLITSLAVALITNIPNMLTVGIQIIQFLATAMFSAVGILLQAANDIIVQLVTSLGEYIESTGIIEKGEEAIKLFIDGMKQKFNDIVSAARQIPAKIREGIEAAASTVKTAASSIIKELKTGFEEKIKEAQQWGKDLIDNFVNGINSAMGNVRSALSKLGNLVKSLIGFSEPEEGPLSNFHTYAPDMMKLFAQGIKENENIVTNQIKKSFDFQNAIKASMDNAIIPDLTTSGGSLDIKSTTDQTAILGRMDAMLAVMSQYFPEIAEKAGNMGTVDVSTINRGLGVLI